VTARMQKLRDILVSGGSPRVCCDSRRRGRLREVSVDIRLSKTGGRFPFVASSKPRHSFFCADVRSLIDQAPMGFGVWPRGKWLIITQ
jgi:hypothetical protein